MPRLTYQHIQQPEFKIGLNADNPNDAVVNALF